jgi:hypothetical protein
MHKEGNPLLLPLFTLRSVDEVLGQVLSRFKTPICVAWAWAPSEQTFRAKLCLIIRSGYDKTRLWNAAI